jgi:5-(carboxyamino)imidazole ribonucleotide mutase
MPNGVPVATVALNAAQNAGILAAQILSAGDKKLLKKVADFKTGLKEKVLQAANAMEKTAKTSSKVASKTSRNRTT